MGADAYSNPLPPPPRPGVNKSGYSGAPPETPRTNADFRKYLDDPKLLQQERQQSRTSAGGGDGDKTKKKKKWRPTKKDGETEDAGLSYRDRAKERRDDKNPDYVGTETEGQSLHNVAPPGQATEQQLYADAHLLSIENSKFLGGDVEHTHLVKGLDFALLQKTRTEMTKKRDDKGEEQNDVEEDKKAKQKQKQAEDAKKADEKKKIKMSFRTQTARTIHNILTGTFHRAIPVREQFQQGRTQFLYELTGSDGFDIPTVVIRAKEDCPRFGDQLVAGVDTLVLERLSKIMGYLRMGSSGRGKKLKKREKAALLVEADAARAGLSNGVSAGVTPLKGSSARPAARDPAAMLPPPPPPRAAEIASARAGATEDDIFGDIGTAYEPAIPAPKPKTPKDRAKPQPQISHFDDDANMEE